MTNFSCLFCEEKMSIPAAIKKKISPVTDRVWHDDCIDNPEFELTIKEKIFWHKMGNGHEF